MIVGGGEDILAGAKQKASIEQPKSHCRAVSQGDLGQAGTEVLGCRLEHPDFLPGFMLHPIAQRIRIQSSAMALNRIAHGRRMRREKETGQMNKSAGKWKLRSNGLPTLKCA